MLIDENVVLDYPSVIHFVDYLHVVSVMDCELTYEELFTLQVFRLLL